MEHAYKVIIGSELDKDIEWNRKDALAEYRIHIQQLPTASKFVDKLTFSCDSEPDWYVKEKDIPTENIRYFSKNPTFSDGTKYLKLKKNSTPYRELSKLFKEKGKPNMFVKQNTGFLLHILHEIHGARSYCFDSKPYLILSSDQETHKDLTKIPLSAYKQRELDYAKRKELEYGKS